MKSLLNGLICASVLVFAAGCGKDGGSSKGGSQAYNPYYGSNLTGTNQIYMQEMTNWMNGVEPQTLRKYGKVSRAISTSANTSSCPGEVKKFLGVFEICVVTSSSSSSSSNGNITNYLVGVGVNNNFNNPVSCQTSDGYNCSAAQVTYPGKANNTKLREALNGHNNTLALIAITKVSSSVYQIAYGANSLNQSPSVIYKIDTSLHSMYNPVEIVNINAGQQEYIQFQSY